jgi:predicted acyl esterase
MATEYDYPRELIKQAEPPKGARKMGDVMIPMRDGIKLCADIYLPEADGKYPALLSLSPYSKDIQRKPPHWSHAIESGATSYYVPKGYVHVIAQGRGAGLSQGKWRWFDERERTDGYDVIEWIAAQPWCTGAVGMIGDSYWSWTQYAAAQAQPPHLKCICQCDSSTDLYRDVVYQGGLYHHAFLSNWIEYHTRMFAWPGAVDGKEEPMNLTYEAARHPADGPFWRERSFWNKMDRIRTPSLHIAMQGGAMHVRGQLWGYARIAAPKKLLVCPAPGFWSHVRYLTNRALNRQMLRWYDWWLKGIDTGIMDEPEVAIFDSGTRAWRYEAEYPIARTRWTKLYLRDGSALSAEAPKGAEAPESYRMPDSYAEIVAGKPVLAWRTAPLDADMKLAGPISVTFHAASSQPDTAFFVTLVELADGAPAPIPVTTGKLKASFRAVNANRSGPGQPFHDFETQELLEPGEVYEFQVEMMPAFRTVKAGRRLELRIASEDIAYSNPLRQIDNHLTPWPVENTIHHDARRPSHVLLPVIPDAPELAPVKAPVAEIDWPLVPGSWSPNTDGWPLEGE